MSDNSKLKPCPFCGASARELAHDQIECSNIECVSFRYMALSFPRELWNTRATSSEPNRDMPLFTRECDERIAELERELKNYKEMYEAAFEVCKDLQPNTAASSDAPKCNRSLAYIEALEKAQ